MPKMGESITEGTIINWLIEEGDSFEEGDILLEVATDKVDNEVPAPANGTLLKTHFGPKDVVPVGEVIATLNLSAESDTSDAKKPEQKATKNKTASIPETNKRRPSTPNQNTPSISNAFTVSNTNQFISPLILSIAKEHHISYEELSRIPATGKEGRLRKTE